MRSTASKFAGLVRAVFALTGLALTVYGVAYAYFQYPIESCLSLRVVLDQIGTDGSVLLFAHLACQVAAAVLVTTYQTVRLGRPARWSLDYPFSAWRVLRSLLYLVALLGVISSIMYGFMNYNIYEMAMERGCDSNSGWTPPFQLAWMLLALCWALSGVDLWMKRRHRVDARASATQWNVR
ncbi:hypothetical protein [Lysinibacter cavernae]|uniref:Uncharacterized protein n=1 Tax=Lysinibacter cavernae TaxID=1640652 RepID=A0A7X5R3Z2_9MICO|nr:hypothetical protein [Lysinibacter cavernae]NIH54917.1 hypothetical protein [Lysinibacter cavernae]